MAGRKIGKDGKQSEANQLLQPTFPFVPELVNPMVDALNYYRHNEDLQKLDSYVILRDSQLRDARINERLAERNGGVKSLPPYMTVSGVIEDAKRRCMEELFMYVRRQGLIQFQVDEESDFPNVIVKAVLYVGKGHDNNINS